MSYFEAILLAIVEGLTEFLPVSSTGHMILTQGIFGIKSDEFTKLFTINIQLGAILSVVVLYWKRFFQTFDFYLKLFIAFIPAAIIGFLLGDYIDKLLESVLGVAIALILGGIILLFIDKKFSSNEYSNKKIFAEDALKIGFFQCIALIPGVSRSGATIIGGMMQGLSRKAAAEFSFFLAVPTMFAATAYKMLKSYQCITVENIPVLVTGNIVAFIVAMLSIKFFIGFLTLNGFKIFGYYRIVAGVVILTLLAMGVPLEI